MARGQTEANEWRYWFDEETDMTYVAQPLANGAFDIDVSTLPEGLHLLHLQAVVDDVASATMTRAFVKTATTAQNYKATAIIDGSQMMEAEVVNNGGKLTWDIDVAALKPGLHSYQVMASTPQGVATQAAQGFFMRTLTGTEQQAVACAFAIDDGAMAKQEGTLGNGAYHFNLDVAQLSDGIHRLNYWLVADTTHATKPESVFFVKIPQGGKGIIQYEYWLNEDYGNRQTILLDERVDPLSVVTALEVNEQTMRTNAFQLKVVDGQLTMVATNEMHFRVADVGGRITDFATTFVDQRVTEPVDEIIPILPQHTVKAESPATGTTRWFAAEAQQGDSILLRISKAGCMQLFAPDGKKVMTAETEDTPAFYGTKATTTGTYYLAVSDMAEYNETVSVTYRVPGKGGIGDVNADGIVSVSDVTVTVASILGTVTDSIDRWNADINNDGEVNISDVMSLVKIILGN